VMTIYNTSYILDIFKYFLVTFYQKQTKQSMKLYNCELIILFVTGKDAEVYNGFVFSWGNFYGGNFWAHFPNVYRPKIKSVPKMKSVTRGVKGYASLLKCNFFFAM
jgi:hypothetical protein